MDPSAELKPQIAVLFIYILIQFVRWYYSSIWQCVFFKLQELQGREAPSF